MYFFFLSFHDIFCNIAGKGKYVYYEASDVKTGEKAVLQSPTITAGSPSKCMWFAYHMYGSRMGELKLERVAANGTRVLLFNNKKSEDAWKEYQLTLSTQTFDYQVSM